MLIRADPCLSVLIRATDQNGLARGDGWGDLSINLKGNQIKDETQNDHSLVTSLKAQGVLRVTEMRNLLTSS